MRRMNTLKQIRAMLGSTQKDVAAALGCTQGNVANYERGQSIPVDVARKLIDFCAREGLCISLDQLYGLQPLPLSVGVVCDR